MAKPIRKRNEYIHAKARDRCRPQELNHQRTDESHGFTEDEWIDWYQNNPLEGTDIKEVIKQWKTEFLETPEQSGGMRLKTQKKILELEGEGSRTSKRQAREKKRSAYKAYLHQEATTHGNCLGFRQLAIMFLIYPVKLSDQLVQCWVAYMTTEEYRTEVHRSQKVDDHDTEAVAVKAAQKQLAATVKHHRCQFRQMRNLNVKTRTDPQRAVARSQDIPYTPAGLTSEKRKWWREFQNGAMLRKSNELTEQHGYGTVYSVDDNNGATSRRSSDLRARSPMQNRNRAGGVMPIDIHGVSMNEHE